MFPGSAVAILEIETLLPMRTHVRIRPEVVLAAREGNVRAFEQIVRAYERPIYTFIYRMLLQRDDTLELTQETFLKLYRSITTYEPQRDFGAWLFTIARNAVYDRLRKRKNCRELLIINDPVHPFDPEDDAPDIWQRIAIAEEQIDVARALGRLRPEHKEILLLYYWQGYQYTELAEILEKPVNTIKTLLRRARQAIGQEMTK